MIRRANLLLIFMTIFVVILAACAPAEDGEAPVVTDEGGALVTEGVEGEVPVTGATETPVEPVEEATEAPMGEETPEASPPAAGATAACPDSGMAAEELISMGEEVFANNCASCHGSEGAGQGEFPALAGDELVNQEDPAPMIDIVLHGQEGMPAFADQLSDEEIAAVISYVRGSFGNQADIVCPEQVEEARAAGTEGAAEGEAALACPDENLSQQQLIDAGETSYGELCAACHGPEGEGVGEFPALANNEDVTTEDTAQLLERVASVEAHAFLEQADPQQVAEVMTYVRNSFGNEAQAICPATVEEALPEG